MDLKDLREELDRIDRQIVELYEQRMGICEEVAEFKRDHLRKVYDKEREDQKIAAVKAMTHNEFNERGVGELFAQIMSMSRKLQYMKIAQRGMSGPVFLPVKELNKKARVVFQGAEGSYSQAAMFQYFGEDVDCFHVDTFRDAMLVLDEGLAEYAVLPIENSTAGIVNQIYDLLTEFEHFIVAEQMVKIEHCLMGVPGASIDDIRTVYSHPQSIYQSDHYLREHAKWDVIAMQNNAFAAQKVAEDKDPAQAAIASEYAAKFYGLSILEKGVNQSNTNTTRFIIISNHKIFREDATKISLCFEVPNESGSLYNILSHFIYNNLNMTKIESRPIEDRNWEYRFFLDFEGNLKDAAVINALCGLREETRNLRILGNY